MTWLRYTCSNVDVHTVASLLKLYLRQLPEPLVPYGRYQEFLLCGQKLLSDRTQVAIGPSSGKLALTLALAASHSPSLAPPTGSGAAEESAVRAAVFKLQLAQLHLPVRAPLPWFPGPGLCANPDHPPGFCTRSRAAPAATG